MGKRSDIKTPQEMTIEELVAREEWLAIARISDPKSEMLWDEIEEIKAEILAHECSA